MAGPDYPDYTYGVVFIQGSLSVVAPYDYPDWTDGYIDITGNVVAGQDFPDWVKAAGQVSGVPVGPRPPITTNLTTWWDASRITGVADGALLATWPDMSGNGYDLKQSDTTKQPTFYSSTAGKTINGKPAVWFNNTTDFMIASNFPTTNPPVTVYYVFQQTGAVANNMFWSSVGNPTTTYKGWQNAQYHISASGDVLGGTPDLVLHQRTDLANGSGTLIRVDGTQVAAGNAGTGQIVSSGGLQVSDYAASPGSYVIKGPLCEMAVYFAAHTTAQMQQTESYLKNKWGTP